MNGYFRFFGYLLVAAVLWSCAERKEPSRSGDIPIISWAGIPADRSAVLFPLLKECGIDWHLGLYRDSGEACAALEEAEKAGVGLIPGFPALKDSTENAVAVLKDSPALVAYHLEDEPELSDIPWLAALVVKIRSLDSAHPPYVNLYPDWAWGQDSYRDNIEEFAANVNVPFYSFDQYPVTEKDGRIEIRPTWYRNLEEFSSMSRSHGKPFWAFALTESHHLGAPSPPAFYPVPDIGQLRLQVFSDLLYGAWGQDSYRDNIEEFAANVNVPFYSFDQYPVTEKDGRIEIRPTWYRNLEEFSSMSRSHGKPFWAFALTESHHLGAPSPPAFYPVPDIGQLRLQVFSDLLYGAQAIQYFTFRGMYDTRTFEKTPVFDIVKQVNAEIKAYAHVFAGCKVENVWHIGDTVPQYTKRLDAMPHSAVKALDIEGAGAVVSLLANGGHEYLAVQNRDCVDSAVLLAGFYGKVRIVTPEGTAKYKGRPIRLSPGDIAVFDLGTDIK